MKVAMVANYKAHSTNKAGVVNLSFTAMYDQITKSMQLLQFLKERVTVKVKMVDENPFMLGYFMISGVSFDKNGVSTIKLSSLIDSVESNMMNEIVTLDKIKVMFLCDIEMPEEEL